MHSIFRHDDPRGKLMQKHHDDRYTAISTLHGSVIAKARPASLSADLLALRQGHRARRRLSRTPRTEELRDDTARATRAWTADHAPRPRRAHLGFDGNAVEARPRATRRILHAVEESYTISHLTLREWGGAAYYMAGKSSMTSFAMRRCDEPPQLASFGHHGRCEKGVSKKRSKLPCSLYNLV